VKNLTIARCCSTLFVTLMIVFAQIAGATPTPVSVTPSSGTGSAQTFSFLFSDTGGAGSIIWTQLMINQTLTTTSSCWFYYDGTLLYLYNDADTGAGRSQSGVQDGREQPM
jgi:hypothetical protein